MVRQDNGSALASVSTLTLMSSAVPLEYQVLHYYTIRINTWAEVDNMRRGLGP